MTIEEMKFMTDHIIMRRAEYNALKGQIEQLQSTIKKAIDFAHSKEDATGLFYARDLLKVLGAEPFEEEEEE